MRSVLLVAGCALFTCSLSFGQRVPVRFGQISMEDMKMKSYPRDSSADAVILADYNVVEIKFNEAVNYWEILFERLYRVKILTNAGLKYADFQIPPIRAGERKERTTDVNAATYNLVANKIITTKGDKNSLFKDVKVGSVIEVSYRKESANVLNLPEWSFQSTIPVRFSEYRATIPEYFGFQKIDQGYVVPTSDESSSRSVTYRYHMMSRDIAAIQNVSNNESQTYKTQSSRMVVENVPAFRSEPFIANGNDYISKIRYDLAAIVKLYPTFDPVTETLEPISGMVSTVITSGHRPINFTFGRETVKMNDVNNMTVIIGSWDQFAENYWAIIGEKIKSNDLVLKDDVAKATAGATTDEQKISQIFEYVRQSVKWNGVSDKIPTQTPKEVLSTGRGSAADINILLTSMIQKTGVQTSPILLSTRDHGSVRQDAAIRSQFNYLICGVQLDDKVIMLDATSRTLPFGVIPERCLNGKGLVVNANGYNWVNLDAVVKSRTSFIAELALAPTGDVNGALTIERTGYRSADARDQYATTGEKAYVANFEAPLHWDISQSEFSNTSDINQSFKETHKFTAGKLAMIAGDSIYFNPFIIGREAENPFQAMERQYPVDFGSTFEGYYIASIKLPEGYKVAKLPQSKLVALPQNGGRYSYSIIQNGDILNFTSSLMINRSVFPQEEYGELREFYNVMAVKQAEQVVLRRK